MVAVEPQSSYVHQLKKKYGGNNRVLVIGKGIGEREEKRPFFINKDSGSTSSFSHAWKDDRYPDVHWEKVLVPVTTLDDLIARNGTPSFCKIDTEGFEKYVLSGLHAPIKALSFEFTRRYLDDTQECLKQLNRLGKYEFNVSLETTNVLDLFYRKWVSEKELMNFIRTLPLDSAGDIYARLL